MNLASSPVLTATVRSITALAMIAAITACDPPSTGTDAQVDARIDTGPPVFDDGVLRDLVEVVDTDGDTFPNTVAQRVFFRPCRSTTDCNPEGTNITLFCDQDYPLGMCRRASCASDAECTINGACGLGFGCLPRCDRVGAVDPCGVASSVCLSYEPPLRTEVGCFPSCYARPPNGVAGCNPGSQCDPYSGRCVVTPSTEGRPNGDPCTSDDDCRSFRCARDVLNAGLGSGLLGGSCVSVGRQVAAMAFQAALAGTEGALPQSNCPDGSVVFPDGEPLGAPTSCLRACTADTDCRAGYLCDHAPGAVATGSPPFRRGACKPLDCRTDASRCPAGTRCTVGTPEGSPAPVGRCTAVPEPTDGGTRDAVADALVDATVTDAPTDVPVSDAGASDASDAAAAPDVPADTSPPG